MKPTPGTESWYAQVVEEIIEPERSIIDSHHHLWFDKGLPDCFLKDLWTDTESGHKIEKTVFIKCSTSYHETGPDHLIPIALDRNSYKSAIFPFWKSPTKHYEPPGGDETAM